ncbi:MAG: hypothetical protein Q8L15_00455 [Methylobacter sp.]|nr:hypothetical protein [Methylobacter sp.]
MPFDLKTAITLGTRRYLAPTVVVILLLAGGMRYVFTEYKILANEKEQLATDRKALYDERVLSERTRADASVALIAQKIEIEKREFILKQLEGQNKERLVVLQQRTTEYETAFEKLQQAQSTVSQSQRQKEVEETLQKLMAEFSAMGVDLNTQLRCGDSEGLMRFNSAKAKFAEIYTLAEANGLVKRFNHFFFKNGQHLIFVECEK